jgi:hypothetical protein
MAQVRIVLKIETKDVNMDVEEKYQIYVQRLEIRTDS